MAHDIFISHSSEDKFVADAICAKFEQHKIKCWVAPRDVPVGSDWAAAIVEAIEKSSAVVFVFSKAANASPQVTREIQTAFEGGKVVHPFKIDETSLSSSLRFYLSSVHWLDAMTIPLEESVEALCLSVGRSLETSAFVEAGLPKVNSNEGLSPSAKAVSPNRPEVRNGVDSKGPTLWNLTLQFLDGPKNFVPDQPTSEVVVEAGARQTAEDSVTLGWFDPLKDWSATNRSGGGGIESSLPANPSMSPGRVKRFASDDINVSNLPNSKGRLKVIRSGLAILACYTVLFMFARAIFLSSIYSRSQIQDVDWAMALLSGGLLVFMLRVPGQMVARGKVSAFTQWSSSLTTGFLAALSTVSCIAVFTELTSLHGGYIPVIAAVTFLSVWIYWCFYFAGSEKADGVVSTAIRQNRVLIMAGLLELLLCLATRKIIADRPSEYDSPPSIGGLFIVIQLGLLLLSRSAFIKLICGAPPHSR